METINYTEFRKEMAGMLDKVNQDHTPLLITRGKEAAAVVMSVEDYNSYQETAYLMASPKNAARLNESIQEIENGNAQTHGLL